MGEDCGDCGEERGEDGSEDGACLLWRGRMVYVPVSQMRSDPVADEAVSMRWFSCRVSDQTVHAKPW